MATFTAGTSFTDGVTGDVTAAKLGALVADATPLSNFITDRTAETSVATDDLLLISDTSDSGALNKMTVANFTNIVSTGTGTAADPAIRPTSDTNTGIFFPAADTIAFSEGGTESVRIDSSGNVGIGTTNPSSKLHISGGDDILRLVATDPYLSFYNGSTRTGYIRVNNTSKNFSIVSEDATTPLTIYTNSNERLRIDSIGRVGIGTTSPLKELQINGTEPTIRLEESGAGAKRLELSVSSSAEAKVFATQSGSALLLGTVGTERLRIDSSGKVGIGTASPSAQLELSTDSAKKPSTNTWTIASDQRLKTNITNADNDRCYEIVKQVPLKRYTWKSEVYSQEQVNDRSKLGWIAQDVEAVFPKAVGTNRFAYNQVFEDVVTPELDSDGNAVLDENGVAKTKIEKRLVSEEVIEDCKDLNSDQIYAAMYGTIQKLIEKVETLESKVAALEAA